MTETDKVVSALTRVTIEFAQRGEVSPESKKEFDDAMSKFGDWLGKASADVDKAKGLFERANNQAAACGVYDDDTPGVVDPADLPAITGKGNVTINMTPDGKPARVPTK